MSDEPLEDYDEGYSVGSDEGYSRGFIDARDLAKEKLKDVLLTLNRESESLKDDTRYNGYNQALEDVADRLGVTL